MTSRTYLSIGDVLTLLREEFPDVTISKIRFLESQGLVNPERSPSGYRKFFDHDVERLRWVLRQQREHFLPLKVIRDRLEDGELDEVEVQTTNGGSGHRAGGPEESAAPAQATPASAVEQPSKADEEAMARILADASRRAAQRPAGVEVEVEVEVEPGARPDLQVVSEGGTEDLAATAEVPSGDVEPEREPAGAATGASRGGSSRRSGSAARRANETPGGGARRGKAAVAAPPKPAAESGGRSRAAEGDKAGADAPSGPPPAMTTGASLTLDELCAASGLSPEQVAGLRSFGLIDSMSVAGIETFDEDALTVANLAASFGSYGIEPRHLRLYRNAVDREVGLIEQVVIPLLRLRNPESRQRAVEGADELARLGQSLRSTLLRTALKRHLGG